MGEDVWDKRIIKIKTISFIQTAVRIKLKIVNCVESILLISGQCNINDLGVQKPKNKLRIKICAQKYFTYNKTEKKIKPTFFVNYNGVIRLSEYWECF
jgi:hypothetical protein